MPQKIERDEFESNCLPATIFICLCIRFDCVSPLLMRSNKLAGKNRFLFVFLLRIELTRSTCCRIVKTRNSQLQTNKIIRFFFQKRERETKISEKKNTLLLFEALVRFVASHSIVLQSGISLRSRSALIKQQSPTKRMNSRDQVEICRVSTTAAFCRFLYPRLIFIVACRSFHFFFFFCWWNESRYLIASNSSLSF